MNKNEESPWGNVNESQRKVAEEGKREEAKKQADETIFVDKKGEARKKEKDRKTGDLVKEFIEDSKKDLKQEKKEAREEEYKQ